MRNLKFILPFLLLAACGGKDNTSSSSSGSSATTRGTTGGTTASAVTGSTGSAATTGASTTTAAGSTGSRGSTAASSSSTSASSSSSSASSSSSGSTGTAGSPTVTATDPRDTDVGFATDLPIAVTFSQSMRSSSLNANTFLLQSGVNTTDGGMNTVAGTISVAGNIATFTAAAPLDVSTIYTVTITTGATDTSGNPLAAPYVFSFTTHSRPAAVNLGAAGNYVILAESKISDVPASAITGDLGISPAAASFVTGFALALDPSGTFSTDSASAGAQITGKVFASDYASPTPSNLTTAITDMGTAFTDAAGRAADVNELGAGEIGGLTLSPGVYKWSSALLISTDLHLEGSATDVWIFEVAQDLSLANATQVFLAGGALPKNIFWQVSGQVKLGTTSHFEGVILSQTQITANTGASVNGRLLAQSAVVLDSNTIVVPAP